MHVLVVQHQHMARARLNVAPPPQRMLKPALVDHVAIEETLEEVVPGALILTQDFVRTVVMRKRDRDIFGMAYDIHPFAVALEHHCGVQPERDVRGDNAGRGKGLPGGKTLRYAGRTADLDREELQELALALGVLQRRDVALVEDGVEHCIAPGGPRAGIRT